MTVKKSRSTPSSNQPIVMVSSYPPRLCGIGTFTEEAREFIQNANPKREVLVVSHTEGQGEGVLPLIDTSRQAWWKPVANALEQLNPSVVHIEHEYGLYEYRDKRGIGDNNAEFLTLLNALGAYPIVVEPHTIHGRLRDAEADFVYQLCQRSDVVLFKSVTIRNGASTGRLQDTAGTSPTISWWSPTVPVRTDVGACKIYLRSNESWD